MKVQKSRICQTVLVLFIVALCVLFFNCDLFKGEGDEYYYDTHYENFPIEDFEGEFYSIEVILSNVTADKANRYFDFNIVLWENEKDSGVVCYNDSSTKDVGVDITLTAEWYGKTDIFKPYREYKIYAFLDNNGNYYYDEGIDFLFNPDNAPNSNGYVYINPENPPYQFNLDCADFL